MMMLSVRLTSARLPRTFGYSCPPSARATMFSTGNFFSSDWDVGGRRRPDARARAPCAEHEDNPEPITGRSIGLPFEILQYRPALALQAYLRFSGVPYTVRNIELPWVESAGRLPVLRDGQFLFPTVVILPELIQRYPELDLDSKLPGGKKAEVEAYLSLVEDKLQPLLRASQHRDEHNFTQNVRRWTRRACRFPVDNFVLWEERRRVDAELKARGLDGLSMNELMTRARALYKALDDRLGASTGDFFFGNLPTSLDASLFGHLAEALADMNFVVFLPSYTNLVAYYQRMLSTYFSADSARTAVRRQNSREDDAGLKEEEVRVLEAAWRRADYVNSKNAFNQAEASRVCAHAMPVPNMMLDKCFDRLPARKKVEAKVRTDEEKEQEKHNKRWLWAVGAVTAAFFALEALTNIATLYLGAVGDEGEEGEDEGHEHDGAGERGGYEDDDDDDDDGYDGE